MTRVALWSLARPRLALGLWLVAVVLLGVRAVGVEDELGPPRIDTAGSQSAQADAAAQASFGRTTAISVLLEGPRRAVRRQARAVAASAPGTVLTAADTRLSPRVRRLLRPDPRTTLLIVTAKTPSAIDGDAGDAVVRVVEAEVRPPVAAAVTGFSVVGAAFADESLAAVRTSEKIAIPVLLIILLLVFRSPVAASLPLILGVGSTISALGLMSLANEVIDIADIAISVCSLMSLALGVDYSLLLLSRFREELRHGRAPDEAARVAVTTAGRTVTFAGIAVLVVMAGLVVAAPGANNLTAGAGPTCGCLAALFGAMVAMPALLGLLGTHVNRWTIGPPPSDAGGRWGVLARWAFRRPLPALVPAVVAVAVLAPSALGLDTGPPDPRTFPSDSEARMDAERVAAAAGPGLLAPFTIDVTPERGGAPSGRAAPGRVAAPGGRAAPGRGAAPGGRAAPRRGAAPGRVAAALARALTREPGVAAVLAPSPSTARSPALRALTRSGSTRRFVVIPKTPPNEPETVALYDRLTALAHRLIERRPGTTVLVGGVAAELTDAGRDIADGFAPLVITIILLTALIMFVVLRAIALPLVSVAINLVSVLAALGVVALLCTGEDPLLGGPGFVDNTALLGVFAIIFALSLDYQVFILERIREEWERTGSVEAAVTQAIDQTARVITGAAAILIGVFATFAIPELQTIRQSGVGLTTAILVDATLVRLVLLPAAISLLGARSFWLPRRIGVLLQQG